MTLFHVPPTSEKIADAAFRGQVVKTVASNLIVSTAQQDVRSQCVASVSPSSSTRGSTTSPSTTSSRQPPPDRHPREAPPARRADERPAARRQRSRGSAGRRIRSSPSSTPLAKARVAVAAEHGRSGRVDHRPCACRESEDPTDGGPLIRRRDLPSGGAVARYFVRLPSVWFPCELYYTPRCSLYAATAFFACSSGTPLGGDR